MQYGFYGLDNKTLIPVTDCPLTRPELIRILAEATRSPAAKANAKLAEPLPLTLRLPAVGEPCAYFDRGPRDEETGPLPDQPEAELTELLCGQPVQVPLRSFWQINPEVADELARTLRAWFAESATPVVVDAYAGVGVFSLVLAGSGAQPIVIEADAAAVEVAARNLTAWGVANAELLTGQTELLLAPVLDKLAAAGQEATVILDPPRTGCADAVVHALRNTPVRQILYVSCNAATLARDVKALAADQCYSLTRLALFDMFPQTMHFETLALLTRAG
jgi:tRNA/tmRNA/rRNA uracil-C5-methylase (TrmA/RlmC/RlmD family)